MNTKRALLNLTILILPFLVGCSSNQVNLKDDVPAISTSPSFQTRQEYLIQSGDKLDIKFFYNPELNESVTVRPDGNISLQLVDEIQTAGLTPSQLDAFLTQKYAYELKKPVLTVLVRSFSAQRVYVGGEINTPGLLTLTGNMTALQAVFSAGGFKDTAKPEGAIIIRKGPDNRPFPVRIDLAKVYDPTNPGSDFALQPYDIVYVPKTWIAEANKFMDQYITKLLLFNGWGLAYGDVFSSRTFN